MTTNAIRDVLSERARQDDRWGEQNHAGVPWLAILMEEVGEFAKALITDEASPEECRRELVQVAAVAIAAIESLDRQTSRIVSTEDDVHICRVCGGCRYSATPSCCYRSCECDEEGRWAALSR